MNLYNTLSQRIETFQPDRQVKVYVCGITPYDTTHLGHAFTYTVFDTLIRYLEMKGQEVIYVQNVTDIDDDILRKAREVGEDWRSLGNRWTAHFIEDMIALNVRPPEHYPRATEMIPEIIRLTQELLDKEIAYERQGSVYYHVDNWPDFGKLSHLPRAEMLPVANERGNDPNDPNKRDPLDFVLWQAQKPGEPAWESPWGPGRPGWHIECSAMSTRLLGETIDIHSGGADLIFPHHECEIAQVEAITGRRPFVRFWLHVAMVRHAGEKMSKSLGNLIMIRDLLETWTADAIRVYLAMHHYRDSWNHNEEEQAVAARLAGKLRIAAAAEGGRGPALDSRQIESDFERAMEADLNTPAALSQLDELAGQILSAASSGQEIRAAQDKLRRMARVFGLRLDVDEPEPQVRSGWERHLQKFTG